MRPAQRETSRPSPAGRRPGLPACNLELLAAVPSALVGQLLTLFRSPGYLPPVLPRVALDLLTLCRKPDAPLGAVLALLEKDALLAMRVLKLAQSPLYAGHRPVASLHEALVRLGTQTLADIFLEAAVVAKVFRCPGLDEPMQRLQLHSRATAQAARVVCRAVGLHDREAFLLGLLHDVGAAAAILAIEEMGRGRPLPAYATFAPAIAEVHAEASGLLAELWRLPPAIYSVLTQHHPGATGEALPRRVAVLVVADVLASETYQGPVEPSEGVLTRAADSLDLNESRLRQLRADTADAISRMGEAG